MLPNLVMGPDETLDTAPVPPMPPPAWGPQEGNANQPVAMQRKLLSSFLLILKGSLCVGPLPIDRAFARS